MDELHQDKSIKSISIFDLTSLGKRLVVRNKFLWNQATTTYEDTRILLIQGI
jgi:hypothetical protein